MTRRQYRFFQRKKLKRWLSRSVWGAMVERFIEFEDYCILNGTYDYDAFINHKNNKP